ncbi:hypothetical protein Tco_0379071 [Tanacetum coccineum]
MVKCLTGKLAKYCKIWYDEDIHDLRSVKTEFPAIAFNDGVSSKTLSCKPTVSSLNNEIDFRISFDNSDDEDYMVVFDKNSFSYKIISTYDLKTNSENNNEKVMPSFPSPGPRVSYFDDLDFFKYFENEFPAVVYNDTQTSKSDLLTELILSPQHIDEFDLNDKTSLSKYDEEEQNVLYFNDLFPFNIIHPGDLKSEKDNDDNEIDIIQSSRTNEITQGLIMLSETSHDKITKTLRTGSFVMNLKVNIVIWNYYGILFYLIMNLYGPFGIPFDPNRYYKDVVYTRMLRRPSLCAILIDFTDWPLPPRDQRPLWIHSLLALGLHTAKEMAEDGFRAYWDFLRCAPSYTYIRDLVQRLCHRLISYNIYERGHAPEKYLFRHAEGRKRGARLSGGHFIGRLAHYFGLVSDDGLRGLSVVARELSLIEMGELVKLNICIKIGDDWAWVAPGSARQQVVAARAPRAAKDAPTVNEDVQADLAPIQAPQQPPHHLLSRVGLCLIDFRDSRRRCRGYDRISRRLAGRHFRHSMRPFGGAYLQHSSDAPGRGRASLHLQAQAGPYAVLHSMIMYIFDLFLYDRIKPGIIMEYLVNISKRRAFWSLNEDILKITILETNTPYPSRKIRRIRACTHQRPQRKEDQYAVSRRTQYAVFKIRHFKTLSLDEFRSPDFNLLSDQEYSEEEEAETMAETIEQYMSKTRADYGSGVVRHKIEYKDSFELKGQFLKELHTNTFSSLDHEDANKHIEKVFEIVDLFHIPILLFRPKLML